MSKVVKSRKRPMKEVNDPKNRCVTFTKRRSGLFSKATELCLVSDAQVAIIVPSLGTKNMFYTFGNNNADTIVDAFLANNVPLAMNPETSQYGISLSFEIKKLESQLDQICKCNKLGGRKDPWAYLEELLRCCNSIEQLQVIKNVLQKLKDGYANKMQSSDSSKFLGSRSGSSATVDADNQITSIIATDPASSSNLAMAPRSDFPFSRSKSRRFRSEYCME